MKNNANKSIKSTIIILGLITGLALPIWAIQANLNTQIQTGVLPESSSDNYGRRLVRSSNGTLWTVYTKTASASSRIFLARSVDNGTSWDLHLEVGDVPGESLNPQFKPAMAIDSNNNLHIIWDESERVRYSKYDGNALTDPIDLPTLSGTPGWENKNFNGAIAIDNNNGLHVVYLSAPISPNNFSQVLYTSNNGSGWATPIHISQRTGMSSRSQTSPNISLGSNNSVHIVWSGQDAANSAPQIWHTEIIGTNQTTIRISNLAGMENSTNIKPTLGVSPDGELVHVIWMIQASNSGMNLGIYANRRTAGFWDATPQIISDPNTIQYEGQNPSVAIDINNDAHVVWREAALTTLSGASDDFYTATFNRLNEVWSPPMPLGLNIQKAQHINLRHSYFWNNGGALDGVYTELLSGTNTLRWFNTDATAHNNGNNNPGPTVAVDDLAQTTENMPVNIHVTNNDRVDPLHVPLTITGFTQGANGGTVTNQGNGILRYAPAPGFNGQDTFTYTIRDSIGQTSSAQVTVTVLAGIDNENPVVTIVSPTNPGPFSNTINILVDATDNVGILSVEFFIDGVTFGIDGSAPYDKQLNTTFYGNGPHIISVTAKDLSGNEAHDFKNIRIENDSQSPTVSIINPSNGSTVSGIQNIIADASDDLGINRVEFYIDSVILGTVTTSPYIKTWDTTLAPDGTHDILAIVYDRVGNSSNATITVNVDNIAENQAPIISPPIPDQSIFSGNSFTPINLDNYVFDDRPDHEIVWTAVSNGLNLAVIINASRVATIQILNPSFIGSEEITFTATDQNGAGLSTSDSAIFSITSSPQNNPPTVEAGNNQVIFSGDPFDLTGTFTDDGVPGTGFISNWTQTDGPTGATILFPNNLQTRVTFTTQGIYTFKLSVNDGLATGFDEVIVGVFNQNNGSRIEIVKPKPGEYVRGRTEVHIRAVSNLPVQFMYFLPPKGRIVILENISDHIFSWDTHSVPGNELTSTLFGAISFVGSGITSKAVTVLVDNIPPTITFSSPNNGATIAGFNTLWTNANDNRGQIDRVEFYVDGVLSYSAHQSPYNFPWDTTGLARPQPYTITAKAFDLAGNEAFTTLSLNVIDPAPSVGTIIPHPSKNAFVPTNTPLEIYAEFQDALPDANLLITEIERQNALKVFCSEGGKNPKQLPGNVSYTNNRLQFNGAIPSNCHVQWSVRVKDQSGGTMQGTFEFINPMPKGSGGRLTSTDGKLEVQIPPNALTEDLYVIIEQSLINPISPIIPNALETHVLAGPYEIIGMNSTQNRIKHLNSNAIFIFNDPDVNITVENGDLVLQVHMIEDDGTTIPIGTSGTEVSQQALTVQVPIPQLSAFQIVSFLGLGQGISSFYNFPNPFNSNTGTQFHYLLGQDSKVTIVIYDLLGNIVKKIERPAGTDGGRAGQNIIPFDGRNGEGHTIANGGYLIRVFAEDNNGIKTKIKSKMLVVK